MAYAVKIEANGGPEVMKYQQVSDPLLGPSEVRVRHTAIGVNYIDVYHRTGLYKTPLPFVPGLEAAGVIEDKGAAVEGFDIGDRVVYGTATNLYGAYSTHRNIPIQYLVKIPSEITDEKAATLMVKGLTAYYLLRRTFSLRQGNSVLIHAAAGGVGTLMCQWAKHLGATVIGTVSSDEKAKWAQQNGCTYPINYKKEDFAQRVRDITQGLGVHVVYDSVGKDTFDKSLQCLTKYGLLVTYGQSSGKIPPFDIAALSTNCVFVTRPSLHVYMSERMDMVLSATDMFEAVKQNILKPHVTKKIPLKDAAEAHKLLEARQTVGSIVLIP